MELFLLNNKVEKWFLFAQCYEIYESNVREEAYKEINSFP